MKILVAGSSGLIGTALCSRLEREGHEVVRLVRREPVQGELRWDPEAGELGQEALEGIEAAVHLGGRNIATGRWTASVKAQLHQSRVQTTQLLSARLAELDTPPRVLVCASAIGIYGHRRDEELDEESDTGEGFWPSWAERGRRRALWHLRLVSASCRPAWVSSSVAGVERCLKCCCPSA